MTARPQRGFTLLEVLVAMAILALGLLALSDLTGGALRNQVRSTQLETATLLARGKLAALQDGYERDGFRDFDQDDEGTFDEEGHPEVRWRVEVVKPQVELGTQQILSLMGGGGADLAAMLGLPAEGAEGGHAQAALDPSTMAMAAVLNQQLTAMGEQIKKGVRELRLTVSWPEGPSREGSFTVVTHLVVLQPRGTP